MVDELFKFVEGQDVVDDIMHISLSDDEDQDEPTQSRNMTLYDKINLAISGE